jgi:hypothetical protein
MTLATISIVAIERVSAMKAVRIAVPTVMPLLVIDQIVRAYPKAKAKMIETVRVARFDHPRLIPKTMPTISPMKHPVRQCRVA